MARKTKRRAALGRERVPRERAHPLPPRTVALSLGLLFAVLHTVGVLLLVGTGGALKGWALGLHFLNIAYTVTAFDAVTFVIGIVAAGVAGAVIGWLFAAIWNWLSK